MKKKCGLKKKKKTKIVSSSPITSRQIGATAKLVAGFILRGSKINADGDCSHEFKRHLLLGRKVMTNLDSTFKSWDTALPSNVHLVKAIVFPVAMYGCKSWSIKKAECWRIVEGETAIFWPPHVKTWLIGKDPEAGRDWGQEERGTRGWDAWMASPTWWIWVCVDSGSWWWRGRPGMLWFMGLQRMDMA